MKKLAIAALALTAAASVFAQGTVNLTLRIASGNTQTAHIWGPSSSAPALSLIGLGSNDTPNSGTTPFGAASGMQLIGQGGAAVQYGYQKTLSQLIGAVGSNVAEASLVPVGITQTFRSGTSLGSMATITDTLGTAGSTWQDAAYASFQLVAWDNSSGNYPTWAQASVAWLSGLIAAGETTEFTVSAIGGTLNTAPYLNDITPLQSFNLYFIPEPSSFALAGLGIAALLAFRRRS